VATFRSRKAPSIKKSSPSYSLRLDNVVSRNRSENSGNLTDMAARKLYYELGAPIAFSSLKHLTAAVGKQQSTKKKKQ
jgi:hypothetical protein